MDTQSNNKNQEEEILEIVKDQVKPLTFDEEVKVENVFDYPILNAPTIRGGKIISGSGDKTFRFEEDKGIWLGNTDYDNAPFKVSMDGEVIASHLQTGTNADEKWIDMSEGRISQKTETDEVVFTDVGSDGGVFGLKDISGNLMLMMSISNDATYGYVVNFDFSYSYPDGILFTQLGKSVTFKLNQTSAIKPGNDNYGYLGTNDYAWNTVYAYNYVDKCKVYDNIDAISLLKKIKPKKKKDKKTGKMIITDELNHATLPDFIREGKNARNLGRYVDLLASAIKQLSQKVEQLEKKLKFINK